MKYRKKPVVIEAVQFDGNNIEELQEFCMVNAPSFFQAVDEEDRDDDPEITAQVWDKLHSTWVGVKDGQWIIKGIQGEFYPCDPDVFEATYEKV
jgi:hypothetical protein